MWSWADSMVRNAIDPGLRVCRESSLVKKSRPGSGDSRNDPYSESKTEHEVAFSRIVAKLG